MYTFIDEQTSDFSFPPTSFDNINFNNFASTLNDDVLVSDIPESSKACSGVSKKRKVSSENYLPSSKKVLTENSLIAFQKEVQTCSPINFSIFPDIKRSFKTIGWECLIEFSESLVYIDLVK